MNAYFDTSALVSIVLNETGAGRCSEIWERTSRAYSTRLLYVEANSAVHRAGREGRISEFEHRRALQRLEELWGDVEVIELDENLMLLAATAAGAESLRGYDAVHCAAGLLIAASDDAVVVSGDRKLLDAWSNNGATVVGIGPDTI